MPAESSGLGSACVFARMAEALTGLTLAAAAAAAPAAAPAPAQPPVASEDEM